MSDGREYEERYGWCQNPSCWRFAVIVPVKYGTTMTCSACEREWPVYHAWGTVGDGVKP